MSSILGTIITIGEFFRTERAEVTIDRGTEQAQVFSLLENRKYIIPDYQREIRWKKENLIELVRDISRGDKFLGNIILNKRNDHEYEIIDGQQRTTTLLMIIYYIKSKFEEELDILQTCDIEMANFDKFSVLITSKFNLNNLSPEEKAEVEDSDVFNQCERYVELWSAFDHIETLQSPRDCADFLSNLRRSQVNLIVNTNDNDNHSIDYFMDVNLKGVKLDNEDIFKGYLFSQDSRQPIRNEWKNFKVQSFKLKGSYPTTKLLEHYLYCDLYKNEVYSNIQFKEDFTINEVEINGEKHYTGEHIIKVIRNNNYMIQCLKSINKFLTIILDVVDTSSPSQRFISLFNTNANVDSLEIIIIHNFIRKIMLDKNVVPRILIMKYVMEVLFDRTNKTKEDYRKIYGLYLLAVVFTVFEGDKDIKKILGVVKDRNWYTKAVDQSKDYFSSGKITGARITSQYKLINSDDEENHMFRCKSLATIYNFFGIDNDKVKIVNGKMDKLVTFVSDSNQFSNEHFIINERGRYSVTGYANSHVNYPSRIKKYANSIFNFIFISRQLNQSLGNNIMTEKIRILDEIVRDNPGLIECEYSRMIIERCRRDFSGAFALLVEDRDTAMNELESYYQDHFIGEFSNYASEVVMQIGGKLGVTNNVLQLTT